MYTNCSRPTKLNNPEMCINIHWGLTGQFGYSAVLLKLNDSDSQGDAKLVQCLVDLL